MTAWIKNAGVILAIVLAGIFAALFALIPSAYDKITAPKARLIYNVISSPPLAEGDGATFISPVTISNDGTKRLTNIVSHLSLNGGSVLKVVLTPKNSDEPTLVIRSGVLTTIIHSMFPGEKINEVVLFETNSSNHKPVMDSRSEETLGSDISQKINLHDDRTPLLAAVLSFVGVISSFAVIVVYNRRGISPIIFSGLPSERLEREDIVPFIAIILADDWLIERIFPFSVETTVSSFSDLIVRAATRNPGSQNLRFVKALKALLLYPALARDSVQIVKQNIKIPDPASTDLELRTIEQRQKLISDPVRFRFYAGQILE